MTDPVLNNPYRLTRDGIYPLADRIAFHTRKAIVAKLGVTFDTSHVEGGEAIKSASRAGQEERWFRENIWAQWTGEMRPPLQGEWYLSGSPIDAYLAPNDLSSPFPIAKLVRIRTVTITVVQEIP